MDSEDLLQWVFDLIDLKNKTQQKDEIYQLIKPHTGEILCYAAFKPNLLKTCFSRLKKKLDLIATGFEQRVKFIGHQVGILPVLCYANCNIREDTIAEYLQKIPEEFLLDELLGRNALKHAVDHGNWESVQFLLTTEHTRNKFLLHSSVKEIATYARSKERMEIAIRVSQLGQS